MPHPPVSIAIRPPGELSNIRYFTPGQLLSTGVISYAIVRLLGASVPGAMVMGLGNMLWEAGSGHIPSGWRRYVLGLFR